MNHLSAEMILLFEVSYFEISCYYYCVAELGVGSPGAQNLQLSVDCIFQLGGTLLRVEMILLFEVSCFEISCCYYCAAELEVGSPEA